MSIEEQSLNEYSFFLPFFYRDMVVGLVACITETVGQKTRGRCDERQPMICAGSSVEVGDIGVAQSGTMFEFNR